MPSSRNATWKMIKFWPSVFQEPCCWWHLSHTMMLVSYHFFFTVNWWKSYSFKDVIIVPLCDPDLLKDYTSLAPSVIFILFSRVISSRRAAVYYQIQCQPSLLLLATPLLLVLQGRVPNVSISFCYINLWKFLVCEERSRLTHC